MHSASLANLGSIVLDPTVYSNMKLPFLVATTLVSMNNVFLSMLRDNNQVRTKFGPLKGM
jgi:hypothetical protein